MTSRDRADRLIGEASAILQEFPGILQRQSWNLAIRRAQEVVELALKGLLAEMGIDYPKIHDVAPPFASAARARGLGVDEAVLIWLETISARLAVSRAPAFYFESEYGEEEARRAVSESEQVMAFTVELLRRLRGG